MLHDLLRRRHMPARERPLAAMPHRCGEHAVGLDREVHGRRVFRVRVDERDAQRRVERRFGGSGREEDEGAEHVFVGLQVA